MRPECGLGEYMLKVVGMLETTRNSWVPLAFLERTNQNASGLIAG